MLILNQIWMFFLAVLMHWQAYMTGGIIIAVMTAYGWLTKKEVSRRTAIVAIIAFVIVAFFMSWRDEYLSAINAQEKLDILTMPRFEGSIDMVSVSPSPTPGGAIILITAHVKNLGAPSIAEFSDCRFTTASGKKAYGEFGPIPFQLGVPFEEPKLKGRKLGMVFSREDNLLIKGTGTPIQMGGAVTGWFYVMVRGMDENEILQPGSVISLTVMDIRGKTIALNHTVTMANTHEGLPHDSLF